MKFKPINGWTRAKMKVAIAEGNNDTPAVTKTMTGTRCVYLTDDGNKCALGCFIPDGHVVQKHVGGARHIIQSYPHLAYPLEVEGLLAMQAIHDRLAFNHYVIPSVHKDLFDWIDNNVWDEMDGPL